MSRRCVPRTLIISVAAQARDFAREVGQMVYKPLTAPFLRDGDEVKLVYATWSDPTSSTTPRSR